VDMEKYETVSDQVMTILARFTDRIEPISVDEAFLDISDTGRLFGTPLETGRKIKKAISSELKLTASIGIAPNKFLAKLASEHKKPDGLFIIAPEGVSSFLEKLPVGKLWGVGKQTEKILLNLGIKTAGALAKYPREVLKDKLGDAAAEHLLALSTGRDEREVETLQETLSMSREHTFQDDVSDRELLRTRLLEQVDSVTRRLRKHGMQCRTACLIFRNTDFTKHTRRATFDRPTDSTDDIFREVERLFEAEDFYNKKVRLIGAGVAGLTGPGEPAETGQLNLFDMPAKKKKDPGKVLDKVLKKHGEESMTRASLLRK
jgi:DNA polymerase-4